MGKNRLLELQGFQGCWGQDYFILCVYWKEKQLNWDSMAVYADRTSFNTQFIKEFILPLAM
jgi:hypothetical protein